MRYVILSLLVFLPVVLFSQTSPFVSPEVDQALRNEISGDIAFDNLRLLTQYHRPPGSIGLYKALQFLENKAKEYGLQKVRIIEQKYNRPTYEPIYGELWMIAPHKEKLASTEEVAVSLADFSRTTHLTAELIDVGDGDKDSDYQGKEVAGKIVLAAAQPDTVMKLAVWKYGAAGIVSYYTTRIDPLFEAPDQIAWSRIPVKRKKDGKTGTFAFMISPRQAIYLKNILNPQPDRAIFGENRRANPRKIKLKVDIETRFHPPHQWYLEALIPGREIQDQDIVLTAHAQEEKFSANDDGSGCVNVLEIGRALTHLIQTGVLPRPKRNIRLWWTNEISSEYQLWKDRPELRDSLLIDINQDMVGAKQSIGNRVQQITLPPLSRHSFLSDVVESIATMVIQQNNAYMPARSQGTPRGSNFTRPMFARLGSREPYHAFVVPYFNSTDHLAFLDGPGGIPAVTLTNWPDEIIHSSDDDLWNIDRTQLKRNAYIVAAIAWYFANVDDQEIPALAGYMYSRGRARLARALNVSLQHLAELKQNDSQVQIYKEARIILTESYKREQEALATLTKLTSNRKILNLLGKFSSDYDRQLKIDLQRLNDFYHTLTGHKAPVIQLSSREKALSKKVPKNNPNMKEYLARRDKVKTKDIKMNPHMIHEVWNFIDGRRSVLEVYEAVFAEAKVFGEWYYGKVSLENVEKLINRAVEKGVLSF
ncbi:MAG: M28 family peptidase [Calditrichaeota bacterium]|nr:MAG: M28 family peptidase [Calditrichota bacterium]